MDFVRPEILRPPSEARSYFLPLTSGCSNNTCIFCTYYGSRLKIRQLSEIEEEIDALALYMRQGIRIPAVPDVVYTIADYWDGRRVFLQDGDALVYPYPELCEALSHLNDRFPTLERIAAYATPQDILRRSLDELNNLRELKLGILYMGVESGDNEILHWIGKGVDYSQMVEAGKRVKEAGVALSVTVILGLGGIERSGIHARQTARILTALNPHYAGALTLMLVPGTPIYSQYRQGSFSLVSSLQSLEELRTIVEESRFSDCFFSSMHASNYFSVRGRLPQDKERMLRELGQVLAGNDPSLLKPEFLRGL